MTRDTGPKNPIGARDCEQPLRATECITHQVLSFCDRAAWRRSRSADQPLGWVHADRKATSGLATGPMGVRFWWRAICTGSEIREFSDIVRGIDLECVEIGCGRGQCAFASWSTLAR